MAEVRVELQKLLEELRAEREHLAVKMNLAKAEVRDEWEELERKWEHLRARGAQITETLGDTGGEVMDDLQMAGVDIKEGYRRLKDLLP
jgi:hypothetical protein